MGKTKLVGAFAFGLASVMNPAFFTGCGSVLGPSFSFGEPEMVALVEVAQTQRYTPKTVDGQSYEVAIALTQNRGEDSKRAGLEPAPVKQAHACGGRTFLRSAAACLDVSEVPVAGTITITRVGPEASSVADKAEATGKLIVYGTTLTNAELEISAGKHTVYLRSNDAKTFDVSRLVVDGKALELAPKGG